MGRITTENSNTNEEVRHGAAKKKTETGDEVKEPAKKTKAASSAKSGSKKTTKKTAKTTTGGDQGTEGKPAKASTRGTAKASSPAAKKRPAKSLANLEPVRTTEEARAKGRKGGLAAAEARRKRKSMKEIARAIASGKVNSPKTRGQLEALGVDGDDMVNDALVTAAVFKEAVSGNMKAVDKWQELTAEGAADENEYELPARVLGKDFVDINREIVPNVKYVFRGGRGGLKSSYISLKIVELIRNNPGVHACVVRKVGATLRDSVFAQMKWAINELGLVDEFEYKTSPVEITYRKTGQKIYFRGVDDPIKLKSIKPAFGYIGILWKEEADQLAGPEEERSINQSVLRGGDTAYEFMSYNPPKSKIAWVNRELTIPDPRRVVHESCYLNVPKAWLGQKFIDDAEHLKEVNPDAYEHEYMGVPNGDGGGVFEYLEARTITDAELGNMDRLYMGVDWGYYPDIFAFVVMYYDAAHETIYLIDEFTGNKMSNSTTAAWIKEHWGDRLGAAQYGVICDSSEMKSISDFVTLGIWNAKAAWKPPGSVDYGMKWLQIRKWVIDPQRTPRAFQEFSQYEYERDKDGNVISGYPDRDNHTIDAARYGLSGIFMRNFTQA